MRKAREKKGQSLRSGGRGLHWRRKNGYTFKAVSCYMAGGLVTLNSMRRKGTWFYRYLSFCFGNFLVVIATRLRVRYSAAWYLLP